MIFAQQCAIVFRPLGRAIHFFAQKVCSSRLAGGRAGWRAITRVTHKRKWTNTLQCAHNERGSDRKCHSSPNGSAQVHARRRRQLEAAIFPQTDQWWRPQINRPAPTQSDRRLPHAVRASKCEFARNRLPIRPPLRDALLAGRLPLVQLSSLLLPRAGREYEQGKRTTEAIWCKALSASGSWPRPAIDLPESWRALSDGRPAGGLAGWLLGARSDTWLLWAGRAGRRLLPVALSAWWSRADD